MGAHHPGRAPTTSSTTRSARWPESWPSARRSPLRTLKMVLNRGAEAPLETALELERKSYAWLRSTHDYEEGVKSFLEKRPPKYEGR